MQKEPASSDQLLQKKAGDVCALKRKRMREIKFRAWDKRLKRMFVPDGLKNPVNFTENIIHMQFTGRLDVVGNEIFEGDILACDARIEGRLFKRVIGEVMFEDHVSAFTLWIEGDPTSFKAGKVPEEEGGITAYSMFLVSLRNFEKIGNVYENPELLK